VKNNRLPSIDFPFEIQEPAQISAQIFEQLRNAIIRGHLKGGQRIVETDLTSALNVSRPPVREALHMLALEGFVEILPYKGARVTKITPESAREHFEIKAMVEGFAGYIAAQRFGKKKIRNLQLIHNEMRVQIDAHNFDGVSEANFKYHEAIVHGVENSRLSNYYAQLSHNIRRYGTIGLTGDKTVWENGWLEHGRILDAIRNKDSLLAQEESRIHAFNALDRVAHLKDTGHDPDPSE
jgi:DNA-binding GntR family transcriptional regulator